MNELIETQRNYFQSGATRSLKARKRTLRTLYQLLHDHERILADAVYQDFGKSFYLIVEHELSLCYGELNRAIRNMGRWNRPKYVRTNLVNFPASSRIVPVPYGITLVIGPWNYPIMLSLIPAIAALAAGNTVVLKPSEIVSNSSAALADLINRHFPRELFHVVEGGVEETTALLEQKFDNIFFTGSTRVGRIVMKAAADQLTPVTLELGGKNPVIVMPDCNLRKSARRIAWGKLHNNGAACVAPDHLYVHESIKDELVREISRHWDSILGEDPGSSLVLPKMVNEKEFDRVVSLIDPAKVARGGGHDRSRLYIEPTLMDRVTDEDEVMQQEVFGPVLPVLTFRDPDELINSLRKKPAPLALYIFTGDIRRARSILTELPSGGGVINEVVLQFINMNTPFGGVGASGIGSYHGKASFETFSQFKTILNKPHWFELWFKYPPYRAFNLRIFRAVLGRSFRSFWKRPA